jgi:hypothetical protein
VKLVLISTAGDGLDGGLALVNDTFAAMARFTGCQFESLLVSNAPKEPQQLARDENLHSKATAFGVRIGGASS